MEKIFKFKRPIKVQGREVKEVAYDEEEMTIDLFNKACENGAVPGSIKESNDKLHVQLFWAAVMAVNHEVEFSTLNQVKGVTDLIKMADIGRNFSFGSEESDQSNSEEQLESTREDITPVLPISKNSD